MSILADQCVSTGALNETAAPGLLKTLIRDVAEYPEQWVFKAIAEHRRNSRFFPVLADLWPTIEPLQKARERRQRFEQQGRAAQEFKSLPAPEGPSEDERRAIVERLLGRKPGEQTAQSDVGRAIEGRISEHLETKRRNREAYLKTQSHRTPAELVAASTRMN